MADTKVSQLPAITVLAGTDLAIIDQDIGGGLFALSKMTITNLIAAIVALGVVNLASAQNLTNKTYNGMTVTSSTGTFTLAAAKTLTISNTMTFTGTDTLSAAFGAGGTVAYLAGGQTFTSAVWNAGAVTSSGAIRGTAVSVGAAATANSAFSGTASLNGDYYTTYFTNSSNGGSATNSILLLNDVGIGNDALILTTAGSGKTLGGLGGAAAGGKYFVAYGGTFGVGTYLTSNFYLGTNNTIAVTINGTTQVVTVATLAGTGSRAVLADASGVLSAPVSNEDWKENWAPMDGIGIAGALKVGWFDWKKKYQPSQGGFRDFGIGAQTAAKVVGPALAGKDNNGWYANRDKLGIIAIAAVNQIVPRLTDHEARIRQLELAA